MISAEFADRLEEAKKARRLEPLSHLIQSGYHPSPEEWATIHDLRLNGGRTASADTARKKASKKRAATHYYVLRYRDNLKPDLAFKEADKLERLKPGTTEDVVRGKDTAFSRIEREEIRRVAGEQCLLIDK